MQSVERGAGPCCRKANGIRKHDTECGTQYRKRDHPGYRAETDPSLGGGGFAHHCSWEYVWFLSRTEWVRNQKHVALAFGFCADTFPLRVTMFTSHGYVFPHHPQQGVGQEVRSALPCTCSLLYRAPHLSPVHGSSILFSPHASSQRRNQNSLLD